MACNTAVVRQQARRLPCEGMAFETGQRLHAGAVNLSALVTVDTDLFVGPERMKRRLVAPNAADMLQGDMERMAVAPLPLFRLRRQFVSVTLDAGFPGLFATVGLHEGLIPFDEEGDHDAVLFQQAEMVTGLAGDVAVFSLLPLQKG